MKRWLSVVISIARPKMKEMITTANQTANTINLKINTIIETLGGQVG